MLREKVIHFSSVGKHMDKSSILVNPVSLILWALLFFLFIYISLRFVVVKHLSTYSKHFSLSANPCCQIASWAKLMCPIRQGWLKKNGRQREKKKKRKRKRSSLKLLWTKGKCCNLLFWNTCSELNQTLRIMSCIFLCTVK